MSRSRNSRKGSKHQGCPAGRKCEYCANNRQYNTFKKLKAASVELPQELLDRIEQLVGNIKVDLDD